MVTGRTCAVARTKESVFAIMTYADKREELEELAKKLENRLAGVNQVDGNPVTLRIRTAIQFRADEGVTDENIYERGLQEILF